MVIVGVGDVTVMVGVGDTGAEDSGETADADRVAAWPYCVGLCCCCCEKDCGETAADADGFAFAFAACLWRGHEYVWYDGTGEVILVFSNSWGVS